MKHSTLCLAVACSSLLVPVVFAEEALSARQLFERMNSRYMDLKALCYTVDRTTASGLKSVEEKWDFKFKAPGFVKIEYHVPVHRIVIVNDAVVWEYIPAAGKAVKTDLAAMPEEKKAGVVASIMSRVALDGLRLGESGKLLDRVTGVTRGKDNIYLVEGKDPRFVIHADGEKYVLVHLELYDQKGDLVLQTDASQFVQAGRDFWFPQNMAVVYRAKKGTVKCQVVISNVSVNDALADEVFQFVPPDGVKVMKGDSGGR